MLNDEEPVASVQSGKSPQGILLRRILVSLLGPLAIAATGLVVWERQQKVLLINDRLRQAQEFSMRISKSMAERNYAMWSVVYALENGNPRDVQVKRWTAYRDGPLQEWNRDLSANELQTCLLLGEPAAFLLRNEIAEGFRRLHRELVRHFTRPYPPAAQVRRARTLAAQQEQRIKQFVREAENVLAARSVPSGACSRK